VSADQEKTMDHIINILNIIKNDEKISKQIGNKQVVILLNT